jgi:hypothetical protein
MNQKLPLTALTFSLILTMSTVTHAQGRERDRGKQEQKPPQRQQSPPRQQGPPQRQQNSANPPVHARREVVRNTNVPARRSEISDIRKTSVVRTTTQVRTQRTFTRTTQGRRYDNGTALRPATQVRERWQQNYFPKGHTYYPYYAARYNPTLDFISPFGFYYGVGAPYILRDQGFNHRPQFSYIEVSLYSGNAFQGYADPRQKNYFNQSNLGQQEPGLENAIDELREGFRRGNIDSLVTLTDPQGEVAIFLKGKYEYSMSSNDFLDLTRDALASTRTIQFDLTQLHKRGEGVYVVSGKHVYRDQDDRSRTVYVSYVLESLENQWTLTQMGTAPDRIQEWK